jgi:hypothetical protein
MNKSVLTLLLAATTIIFACESNKDDQRYTLCDVLTQPKLIVNDSIEIIASDLYTPSGDGYNDFFRIYGVIDDETEYPLNRFFTDVSFTVYNSGDIAVFTIENQIKWDGLDENGNRLGDGIYRYELRLDDKVYERLVGMFTVPFCLDDLNCSLEIEEFDEGDPLIMDCH